MSKELTRTEFHELRLCMALIRKSHDYIGDVLERVWRLIDADQNM